MSNPDNHLTDRYNNLRRTVFSTPKGQEFLELMVEIYVDCPLYDEDARREAYLIGQRDLAMELSYKTGEENEG